VKTGVDRVRAFSPSCGGNPKKGVSKMYQGEEPKRASLLNALIKKASCRSWDYAGGSGPGIRKIKRAGVLRGKKRTAKRSTSHLQLSAMRRRELKIVVPRGLPAPGLAHAEAVFQERERGSQLGEKR